MVTLTEQRLTEIIGNAPWVDHTFTNEFGDKLVIRAKRKNEGEASFPVDVFIFVNDQEVSLEWLAQLVKSGLGKRR